MIQTDTRANPTVKRVMPYILLIDVVTVGAVLAIYIQTHSTLLMAVPMAIGVPLLAVVLFWAVKKDRAAAESTDSEPRIVK